MNNSDAPNNENMNLKKMKNLSSFEDLEQYRDYLRLLGRMQVEPRLAAKVDVSGVVQLTLMEAYQDMDVLEPLSSDRRLAWLRRVFANNLLDEIRRFRAQARDVDREQLFQRDVEASASRLDQLLVDPASSPSRKAIRSEEALRLMKALACLSPTQRKAIELHHLQGLPLAEVGERMQRDKGAVAALVYRGTKRLRELLKSGLQE